MNKQCVILFFLTIVSISSFDAFGMRPVYSTSDQINRAFARAVVNKNKNDIDHIVDSYPGDLRPEVINRYCKYAAEHNFFHPLDKLKTDERLDENVADNAEFLEAAFSGSKNYIDDTFGLYHRELTVDTMLVCLDGYLNCSEKDLSCKWTYSLSKFFDNASRYTLDASNKKIYSLKGNTRVNTFLIREVLARFGQRVVEIFEKYHRYLTSKTISYCYEILVKNRDIDTLLAISKYTMDENSPYGCARERQTISFFCKFINALIRGDASWLKEHEYYWNDVSDNNVQLFYQIAFRNGHVWLCEIILKDHWDDFPENIVNKWYQMAANKGHRGLCKVLSNHPSITCSGRLNAAGGAFMAKTRPPQYRNVDYWGAFKQTCLGFSILGDAACRYIKELPKDDYIWD